MRDVLEPTDLLTPEELAERLKVSPGWLYEQTRSRGRKVDKPLPYVRCGRYLRFIWSDVAEWLRNSTR